MTISHAFAGTLVAAGAYEGVTGSMTSKERADGSSVDSVRLIRR